MIRSTGGHDCPIKITPPSVVVRYGDPVTINCSSLTDKSLGIAWEATQGGTGLEAVSHLSWSVERLTDWNIAPYCSTYLSDDRQCNILAEVILYSEFAVQHPTEQDHTEGGLTSTLSCSLPKLHWHQLHRWFLRHHERRDGL